MGLKMKKRICFLSIGVAILILLAGTSPVFGSIDIETLEENQNIIVEVNKYLGGKTKSIFTELSYEEAEELKEILINLNTAIEENDEKAISFYEKILNERGFFGKEYQKIFSRNSIFEKITSNNYPSVLKQYESLNADNISNTLCFFNAIGKGIIVFPFDLNILESIIEIVENASSPLAGLILLLILLPILVLFMLFTHLIPFRILMSRGVVIMNSGSVASIGLNGLKRITVTEQIGVNVSWFTGITFNIPFTNNSFCFMSGFAARVYEGDI
jgi:hypothetical protein